MFAFLLLCLPPSQYLNLVHFACSWAHLDTQELPKNSPQNHSQNGQVVVEVSPSIFAFSSYADPLLGTLIWFVLHVPGLIQIPKHSLKKLTKLFRIWLSHCGGKSLDVHCFTLMLTTSSGPQTCHSCLIWPTSVLFLYISQVLLYSGKGQYNLYSLSTRTFLLEAIPTRQRQKGKSKRHHLSPSITP